jgi:hypothetical protein
MKGMEIMNRPNKSYGRDALQRRQVYYWIKELKSGTKDFQTPRDQEAHQVRDWMTGLGRRIKRILIFNEFNEKNHKSHEYELYEGVKPFGDEIPRYAMGHPHIDSGTKDKTSEDNRKDAAKPAKPYSLQLPLPVDWR